MRKNHTGDVSVRLSRGLSLTVLILTATALLFVLITTITVGVASGISAGTAPEWANNFAHAFSTIIAIEMDTVIILSIVLGIVFGMTKKLKGIHLATCLLNWILAFIIVVANIVQIFATMDDTAKTVLGALYLVLIIALIVLDSITFKKVNNEYRSVPKAK